MSLNPISGGRFGVTVRLVIAGVVLLAAVALVGGAATADSPDSVVAHEGEHDGPSVAEKAFIVQLDEDGDAEIDWTISVMNLSNDAEAEVFQDLRSDTEWQQERVSEFENQWRSIVADTSEETGREMLVSNTTIEFEEVENAGVIRLSLTWEGLAASSGEELVLTEPFVTMNESPWPLYVELPAEYETAELTVETDPAERSGNYLAWNTDSDLSGFSLTAVESGEESQSADDSTDDDSSSQDDGTDGAADGTGPGFGIVAALAGLFGWWRLSARN